ncbi:MAG TPA: class I SAM-dependent methyltransferase [Parachlamydiaceae bacterium]|nr:class I SAM-dependent methyltransferase [Parachlamydiaceae bacterium]
MDHIKKKSQKQATSSKTSWEPVEKWYRGIVGEEGHYYHKNLIIPELLRLLEVKKGCRLLDLGCGDGILGRHFPENLEYQGVDIAPSFIKAAKGLDKAKKHYYAAGDVTKPLPIQAEKFTHATIVLAIQNIEFPQKAFENAAKYLEDKGQLIIVMNHPCFRIPRQSSWQIDEQKKLQYRRIDRYQTPMQIPIQAHPSQGKTSPATVSFHYPISKYINWLNAAGFYLKDMEEWCSDKQSTGKAAKMENRSREEFPLFLALIAEKK